jgi:hypothetical protein
MKQLSFIEEYKNLNNINKNIKEDVTDLLELFPNSFINEDQEFIAVPSTNLYFLLGNVSSPLELKCKVLEWFSRDAFKSMCFRNKGRNKEYQDNIRSKINEFLGTDFTRDDMELIYTYLGNNINRDLCIKFIESDYNLQVIKDYKKQEYGD